MRSDDFREDLAPTRGQLAEIAREWTRLAGEEWPETRVAASELLLRLKTSPTPDPASEHLAAAQRALHVAQSAVDNGQAPGRVRLRDRGAGPAR